MAGNIISSRWQCHRVQLPRIELGHAGLFMFSASRHIRTRCAREVVSRQGAPQDGQSGPPRAKLDPRQSISRQPPVQRQTSQPPAVKEFYLPRNLLMNKQVIALSTGKQLGYVAQLYVDPQRLEVVSLDLKPNWLTLSSESDSSILLSSLRQIGDVLLVHDESAMEEGAAMGSTWGAVKLVGMPVETEDGQTLGKVREYTFSPNSGQIDSIKFDRFGMPAVSASVVSVFALPVGDVVRVEFARVLVRRSPRVVKESDGILDKATEALFDLKASDEEDDYARQYEEWERKYGAAYRQYSREEAPARASPAMPAVQPMAQLPPPQQREYRKRLITQPYKEPEQVVARSSMRATRRSMPAQSMPEPQYRSAAQPDSRRTFGREQRESSMPEGPPGQESTSLRRGADGRPAGIPIIDRKQKPAYRRQDVDGRYGSSPGYSSQDGSEEAPNERPPSNRRPTFEEFLRSEKSNVEVQQ